MWEIPHSGGSPGRDRAHKQKCDSCALSRNNNRRKGVLVNSCEFSVEVIVLRAQRGLLARVLLDFFPPLPRFPPSFKATSADFTPWPNPLDLLREALIVIFSPIRGESATAQSSLKLMETKEAKRLVSLGCLVLRIYRNDILIFVIIYSLIYF